MAVEIRERRRELGVSLDELAAALGPGFSRARLSIAERGLIDLSKAEQEVVLAAVERVGELRAEVRRIVKMGTEINLRSVCADIRQRAHALQVAAS